MSRFHLEPHKDKQSGIWRLNVPVSISPTGRRQRLFFPEHWKALAAAKSFKQHYNEFGLSSVALSPSRRIESAESWQMLDEVLGEAKSGSMREIIAKAVKAMRETSKSITLDELWVQYIERMKRIGRSANYIRQIGYARKAFDFWSDARLPEISPGNVDFCTKNMPSGARNAHLAILRTAMNFAIKKGHLSENPVLSLEFTPRPKLEIKFLSNDLVEAMLRHAAEHEIELLPYLTIGFYCGCREAELTKLQWSDVNLEDSRLMVRFEISKTRSQRFPPIFPNAMEWLKINLASRQHLPSDRIIEPYTLATLRSARRKNFAEAGGVGHIPTNAKRKTFGTNHLSAYHNEGELTNILGHTSIQMTRDHYASNVSQSVALAYFAIRP
jgi:integrase